MSNSTPVAAFDPVQPVCFFSPHLDDVVLSCGHYLASRPGAQVVTAFAGAPAITRRDGWNAKTTGRSSALDAIALRRNEDAAALTELGAHPYWLDLWEAEYLPMQHRWVRGRPQDDPASRVVRHVAAWALANLRSRSRRLRRPIREAVEEVLEELRPASVVAPLGLHHPDHRALSAACLATVSRSEPAWYLYLDMPYALSFPNEARRRLSAVRRRVKLESLQPFLPSGASKANAAEDYQSQVSALATGLPALTPSLSEPERYWRVVSR